MDEMCKYDGHENYCKRFSPTRTRLNSFMSEKIGFRREMERLCFGNWNSGRREGM